MALLVGEPALLGYIPQPFRVYGRPMTKEASFYLPEFKNRIREDVAAVLREHGERLVPAGVADPNLGEVPNLAPLVQMAQREGVSTWECSSGTPAQRGAARRSFMHIANGVNTYAIRSSAGAVA